jgi:hypothetical protein
MLKYHHTTARNVTAGLSSNKSKSPLKVVVKSIKIKDKKNSRRWPAIFLIK